MSDDPKLSGYQVARETIRGMRSPAARYFNAGMNAASSELDGAPPGALDRVLETIYQDTISDPQEWSRVIDLMVKDWMLSKMEEGFKARMDRRKLGHEDLLEWEEFQAEMRTRYRKFDVPVE